jgi:multidrug resistance efflux pump
MAWLIRYPDTVNGSIVITSPTPPAKLIALSSGKITRLFTKNNDSVKAGANLALLENSASFNDVMELKKEIEAVQIDSLLAIEPMHKKKIVNNEFIPQINRMLQVGELQNSFNQFYDALLKYQIVVADKSYNKIATALHKQLKEYEELNSQLLEQGSLQNQKTELEKSNLEKSEKLNAEKVISTKDLEDSKKKYYDQLMMQKNAQTQLIQNILKSKDYEKNLVENEKNYKDKLNESITNVRTSFEQLCSDLSKWQQKYIIKAPIDGKIVMTQFWAENQFVKEGEWVMTVVPDDSKLIGKIAIPLMNSGKIKPNAAVKIKLDNFPFQEYGILKGTVRNISALPIDGKYIVDVNLPEGYKTSYGKELPHGVEFQGDASIITKDVNLLQKFFEPFKSLKNNQ